MNKVLLCCIPMSGNTVKAKYLSDDIYFPVADTEVRYPIIAFYEKALKREDNLKIVLLTKEDPAQTYVTNMQFLYEEIGVVEEKTGARITTEVIQTSYKESMKTEGDLLLQIVKAVGRESEITIDMTFSTKEVDLVLFSALNFAEKYAKCEIANIIYGKEEFSEEHNKKQYRICELAPMYYISRIMNDIECSDPDQAVNLLNVLLDM